MPLLKFNRITEFDQFKQIPRYLFEQMENKDFDVDRLFAYAPNILGSYYTLFYIMIEGEAIKGFL